MQFFRDFGRWLVAVFNAWHGWLSSSALAAAIGLGHAIGWWEAGKRTYIVILAIGVIISFFEAWRHADKSRRAAEEKADVGRPKLSIKFPYGKLAASADFPQMWLVNFGDRVATDITIEAIHRGPYEAVFPQIQNVAGQPSGLNGANLVPTVTKDGIAHPIFSRNGQHLCDMMLEGLQNLADEIRIPVTIKFRDGGIERTNTLTIHCNRPSLTVNVVDQIH